MKSDGRLIQDIQNSGQTGTDLRSQTDALGFPAGQSVCCPVQRKIIQADGNQKTEAFTDFLNDGSRYSQLTIIQAAKAGEVTKGGGNRHTGNVYYGPVFDSYR